MTINENENRTCGECKHFILEPSLVKEYGVVGRCKLRDAVLTRRWGRVSACILFEEGAEEELKAEIKSVILALAKATKKEEGAEE